MGAKLVVLNLSQQTDSSDLLGGFRPVQPAEAVLPLLDRFADLVRRCEGQGDGNHWTVLQRGYLRDCCPGALRMHD